MAQKVGKYQHERNENLDGYFKAVGVPYIPRKMVLTASPTLEIKQEGDKWTIRTISIMCTSEITFTLEKEFEEAMASGVTLKNVAKIEGDSIIITSTGPNVEKTVRKYDFTDEQVILTMTHEQSGQVAKRFFKRIA
ncbi:sodium/calcium exchanger regulatory protein 1-like [Belonocnema kinseyi]|uniref:sodium/calcium exchanger regulatory protein 1-like n=1 Tax=Belonocnema kinseyi TaxID=2817044 RepID=UPI00143DAAC7|nr:sodium/calcium exchanger regulatory protein 1-like [Belonocnema kinseyi]XP_033230820.1 sodium/calcium exchanger regulatory protein 1-like [Belonocnema kinseyi]XP_033230821.1 sodium/calcium exchanger regulatory protein 1-like [Belonocnema kinseyi]